ncbi:hypothetical protein Btru_028519 [Bulinus truncatus]|nr:hypothetical protein Btru_028519 [Bulinus truncatus]
MMLKTVSQLIFVLSILVCCHGAPVDEESPEETPTVTPSVPEEPPKVESVIRRNVVETVLNSPGSPFRISLVESASSRAKRAVGNSTKPWPRRIPYFIDNLYKKLGPYNTIILKRAMRYIMDRVCIEFVDVTDTYKPSDANWLVNNGFEMNSVLSFSNSGGCNADVGPGTKGGIRTNNPCYDFWINLHELGHSIGAMHVQESPTRDNYISVYNDNIQPSLRFSYRLYADSVITSYVDPKSVLMYSSKTWTNNGLETYTTIVDDFFNTVSDTSSDDALYSDLNVLYKCKETYCNDVNFDCSPGYMARVKGICRCVCPEERDEGNNCKTLRNGPLTYAQWPNTPLVLLAGGPQHTCPEGFTQGWFSFTGKYAISQTPTPPVVFPSSGTTNNIPVCTKDTPTGSDIDWESWNPGGQYCMIKPNVPCGGAFVESQADIQSLAAITINGSVGDTTTNGNNLTQKYCCRFQESSTFPTELPNAAPFRLFVRSYCPRIRGLKSFNTRNNWWSSVASIKNVSTSPWWYFSTCLTSYTCYYQPPVYGCNQEITLDANTKTATVTTPGFPNSREPNRRCFYSFNVPPGSRIKITFNTVDLSTTNDDTFQYKRFHKWQDPNKIDPTNWPKEVLSEGDYFTAEYWSGFDVTTKKGVSFTATLITPEDMCYDVASKGADYSGNTYVSETFEECLPWSKAVDCLDFSTSSSIWLLQSGNSCRNPRGKLLQPYCYVNINGTACMKRYCDVCSLKSVVDIIKTCSALMAADPGFCSTSFSKFGCAKSCAYTPVPSNRGTCDAPTVPSDGTLVSPTKSTYNEGEIVQVQCAASSSDPVSEMRCTQSGWTSLTSACKGDCSDKIDFCQDLLQTFPRFCSHTKTKDSAVQYCAKSCANCSVTTTCSAPSVGTFSRTSVSDTVNNGDVMTFSCNAGLYYWSGNNERACGLNGELLGSNLECQSQPPATDVNLNLVRKRTELLNIKIAYLLDKDEFKIPIKGVITRWYYYCKTPGVMTFAVYRKTNNVFSYVGANNVTCQPDYQMTYYVPAESQIPVEVNDILAVHSTASNTLQSQPTRSVNSPPKQCQGLTALYLHLVPELHLCETRIDLSYTNMPEANTKQTGNIHTYITCMAFFKIYKL